MKRVFAYLRVSGISQLDGGGFDRQESVIRAFCQARGWIVARVFKEQQSGADEYQDRKIMADMMLLCSEHGHGINTVVVENSTRVARDVLVQELLFRDCKKKSIEIYSAEGDGQELTNIENDPTRTLMRQIIGALSQWERATISKRLQAGRRRRSAETGKPCGARPHFTADETRKVTLEFIKEHKEQMNLGWSEIARIAQQQKWPQQKPGAVWQRGTVKHLYEKYCKDKNP